jgi:hypothetical protein
MLLNKLIIYNNKIIIQFKFQIIINKQINKCKINKIKIKKLYPTNHKILMKIIHKMIVIIKIINQHKKTYKVNKNHNNNNKLQKINKLMIYLKNN